MDQICSMNAKAVPDPSPASRGPNWHSGKRRSRHCGHERYQRVSNGRLHGEAMHELGHTFGLGHYADPGCVMWFSNTLGETDRKGAAYFPRCEDTLHLAHRRV